MDQFIIVLIFFGKRMNFSIIIPIYNTPYLYSIIKNILSSDILNYNFEIIVVDDGSNKSYFYSYNQAISQHSCVYYYFLGNKKGQFRAGQARNIGAKKSQYSTLVFLDQDSFIHRKYFSLIENKYSGGLLTGSMLGYNNYYKKITHTFIQDFLNNKNIRKKLFEDIRDAGGDCFNENFGKVSATNMIIEKKIFLRINGFDTNMKGWGFEDVELGYRIKLLGENIYYDNSLSILNMSSNLYGQSHSIFNKKKILSAIPNLIYIYRKHSTPEIKRYIQITLSLFKKLLQDSL